MSGVRDDYDRSLRLYNAGDLDAYANEYAEDAVLTTPDATLRGRSAIRDYWLRQRATFPDCVLTPELLVEDGNLIVTEWTWAGTNMGPVTRRDRTQSPATGRRVELRGVELAEIRNGKISACRMYWDGLAILSQLGIP